VVDWLLVVYIVAVKDQKIMFMAMKRVPVALHAKNGIWSSPCCSTKFQLSNRVSVHLINTNAC